MFLDPEDVKLDYSDVLFRPQVSNLNSRKEVELVTSYTFKNSGATYTGVPIMAANMDGVGTSSMAIALAEHGMFTCITKSQWHWLDVFLGKNQELLENVALTMGISEGDKKNLTKCLRNIPTLKYLCLDVANGYTENFVDYVSYVRDAYPELTIIAGNVVTPELTERLLERGADIVKVGIGPGSVCTTRIKTGVGYPQLSAVIECADAAHGVGGHIIADGGCTCPGDVAKAFGAGADFVMLGGMLAGCDEGGGNIITRRYLTNECVINPTTNVLENVYEEKKFVEFYGMSSGIAQKKHFGYRSYRTSEGRVAEVPYKGPVENVVLDILGGVRSTCTYVGAESLNELSNKTTFVRVNNNKQYNSMYEGYTKSE